MTESHNRTLICSVLFIDIVEYSRKPVVEQIALKDRFNELLSSALRDVAVSDRIILDTGDGAAISFIGDPEDALFVAADLRDVVAKETEAIDLELGTRMGINLGPVRLVKDINGQPNIIGDGINVAQRVMSFAKPGQILVSRSYFEVVSRLSEESSKLFEHEGSRTDKHIREHEVYGVGDVSALPRRAVEAAPAEPDSALSRHFEPVSRTVKGAVEHMSARPRLASAIAVAAILTIAIGGRLLRDDDAADTLAADAATAAERPQVDATPAPALAEAARAAAPVEIKVPARPTPAEVKAVKAESTRAAEGAPPATRRAPPAVAEARKTLPEERKLERTEAVAAAAAVEEPAMLTLAISPWGQVYVNGRMRGVSPPLQELEIPPGKHRVEVRNEGSATHVVSVNAKPGERVKIKHKFQ